MVLSELLAPAGSYEVFLTAVNAGADAVYIAGNKYGARAFANNFTMKEIKKAVEYAHLNKVKVHVTVNTLVNDFEIVDVLDYLFKLYQIGVDAAIVQDFGVAYLLKMLIPDFEVHASTQMALSNYSSIKWAYKNNIKRVVLPREINIDYIKKINENLKNENINMELEVFGHGALCYSVSGNCYMSSYNSGRSGNRGACAQPCRREYKLKYRGYNVGNGYLLSTHDLATYKNIKNISDAGVTSLKLEGRMKSADYVGTIVDSYRHIIDEVEGDYDKNLNLVFNRKFTNGYLLGDKPGEVLGRKASGHEGLYIGDITNIDGTRITIDVKNKDNYIPLELGDGIGFKYNGKIKGIYLEDIISQDKNQIVIDTTRNVKVGTEVFISYRKAIHEDIKKIKKEIIVPKHGLSLKISWNDKLNALIIVEFYLDDELINFKYEAKDLFEIAINQPVTEDKIKKQLSKTGGTPFYIENIQISNIPSNIFITMGNLNKIRRDIIEKAEELLLNHYTPTKKSIKATRKRLHEFVNENKNKNTIKNKTPSLSVFVDDLDTLNGISGFNFKRIYFDGNYIYNNPDDYFKNIEGYLEKATLMAPQSEVVWVLSTFLSEEDAIKSSEIVKNLENKGIVISIMGDYPSLKEHFNCPIYGNHNLNVWNSYSVKSLSESGFDGLILSSELSEDEIREIIQKNTEDIDLEMIVHGNLEVIVSKDDFSNLNNGRDFIISNNNDYAILEDKKRKKFKYKVSFDYNNFSHIANKDCLCLIEEINNIKSLGLDNLIIDCRYGNENYAKQIVSYYNEALKGRDDEELSKLKYKIMDLSHSYINKGNYIDGRLHEDKERENKNEIT